MVKYICLLIVSCVLWEVHTLHKKLELRESDFKRIIVTSDIHGYDELFDDLINQLNLSDDDLLIINGDIINKGPSSLKLLRKIMAMTQSHDNIIMLKGNHESFIHDFLITEDYHGHYLDFLKREAYPTILHEMADAMQFDLKKCPVLKAFTSLLNDSFSKEIDYMNNLPILIETEHHVIVHSGYEENFNLPDNEDDYLKYDYYDELTKKHDKTIVVGHMPACNLREKSNSNMPFFNKDKNVITIDGGLGVKVSGELNALIIHVNEVPKYDVIQVNNFKTKTIVKSVVFEKTPIFSINWPHFDLELIERGDLFSSVKHCHSGRVFNIFNSLLEKTENGYKPSVSYVNRFFNLKVGDEVELCKSFSDCHLVKYCGEFGWVLYDQIAI